MKKLMHKLTVTLALVLLGLAAEGCATRTSTVPVSRAVAVMQSHRDYTRAKACAPEWTRDSLHLMQDMETRIKELEVLQRGRGR